MIRRRFWTVENEVGQTRPEAPGRYSSLSTAEKALEKIPAHIRLFYSVKGWKYRPASDFRQPSKWVSKEEEL